MPPTRSSALVCAFIGDDSLLIRCAETTLERGHAVACVVTASHAVRQWAASREIPTIDAEAEVARPLAGLLAGRRLDCLFSVANLRPVSDAVLRLAETAVNFHDGPLPRYGGVHAPAWAIIAGERDYAISWHRMTQRLDAGAVLVRQPVTIDADDTSLTLNLKCFQAGDESFAALLDGLARGALDVREHALDRATYHRRSDRVPLAATLDFTAPARALNAIVRALDFGGYRNTLGCAKVAFPGGLLIARRADVVTDASTAAPGTVVRAGASGVVVSTGRGDLRLDAFTTLAGAPLSAADAVERSGLVVGQPLRALAPALQDRISALDRESAPREEFWVRELARPALDVPSVVAQRLRPPDHATRSWRWRPAVAAARSAEAPDRRLAALATVAAWLGHNTAQASFTVSLSTASLVPDAAEVAQWFMDAVPLTMDLEGATMAALAQRLAESLESLRTNGLPLRDLIARTPELRDACAPSPVAVMLAAAGATPPAPPHAALAFAIDDAGAIRVGFDPRFVDESALESFDGQIGSLRASARAGAPVAEWSILDPARRQRMVESLSGVRVPLEPRATITSRIAAQVARTPDATAIVGPDRQLTYRELAAESDRLAAHLRGLGVGSDVPVGLYLDRSAALLVAVLGVMKAGGAYLPLDPAYPRERLQFMVADSGAPFILTSRSRAPNAPASPASRALALEDLPPSRSVDGSQAPALDAARHDALAYLIYTSGSTGSPKGVMVEHRNVTSFFAAMDRALGTAPVRWLAVTSLSFDISVLELLWPLTNGSTVVIAPEGTGSPAPARLAFSLFYFSADERGHGAEKYTLLTEGARFADTHGFAAVWTPERHFHEFGGIFPNPSVTSAAIAAITTRVAIRAGSVVLPLHHPLRIAEEWSVVDNLSNGRVAISFASGWRPEDFVLRPEGFADAKKRMLDGIDVVRRLWRGEALSFEGPDRKPVEVAIHPRPVQAELPVFITAAGSPDTFEAAGRSGCGVLTHLLGQSLDELREKIGIYRAARAGAGHAGPGHVALMLHTFVGDSDEEVRDIVRGPMKAYLRTSVSLIEKNAQAFPTFRKRADGSMPKLDFGSLSEQEADALLEYSFERYFETSGMFGTVERCVAMAEGLAAIGVDDVACLIDFGVDPALVLEHLTHLDAVRTRFDAAPAATIPALMREHRVTHLQCTPSQALLLLADPAAREYLPALESLLVGGEALAPSLARSLRDAGVRRLFNMYGPTETTVWSTCHEVRETAASVPIGRPIANTFVRIAGIGGSIAPPGVAGELMIGGPGVTRGYLGRDELTRERFVDVVGEQTGRMYRTGDQARLTAQGELEFLGRGDTQVKVRGYRIELGEIEHALGRHAAVSESAVVVQGDRAEDRRLLGYVTLRATIPGAGQVLREHLRATLPEFMIPSQIIVLAEFPRTPNGKTDRRRLPLPEAGASARPRGSASHARAAVRETVASSNGAASDGRTMPELQQAISAIWCDVLHVEQVGLDENFFDVGGHSLLAVQVHQRVKSALGRDFPITDLFRFSTVRALAEHLGSGVPEGPSAAGRGADRAALRRQASQRRQQPDR